MMAYLRHQKNSINAPKAFKLKIQISTQNQLIPGPDFISNSALQDNPYLF